MYRPTFAFDAVGRDDPDARKITLEIMGEAILFLARVDLIYLKTYPDQFLPLYQAGIHYGDDRPAPGTACGDDDWRDVAVLYRLGVGDCEDLASARIAELWRAGQWDVTTTVLFNRTRRLGSRPEHLFHIFVRWPEGLGSYPSTVQRRSGMLLECPSEVLGMPVRSVA